VTNTRQITRAMKMVSAARLRRAQERALAARPYAQMLTNVLQSLVSRADVYDPATGELLHPLLVRRPEQNVLLIVVTGDKGLAGAFNANILKAAMRFLGSKSGKNVEIEAIGRKGRDFFRRRFKTAEPRKAGSGETPATTLVGEQVGVLNKIEYPMASELAERVMERYTRGDIDSVYLVFNEFKSVIAQRLVVEQVLPIEQIGAPSVAAAKEMDLQEKKARHRSCQRRRRWAQARRYQGGGRTSEGVCNRSRGLHLRAAAAPAVSRPAAEVHRHTNFSRAARVRGGRTRRPHDRDGIGH
jgi:F-type H+-transporting ATPase subunit gamma